MAELLKGSEVAKNLKKQIIEKNEALLAKGVQARLNLVRIGEQEDDRSYERSVLKNFNALGIQATVSAFPENISSPDFAFQLNRINQNNKIHGILLFQPLPRQIKKNAICNMIHPDKDVDCMHTDNIAKLFSGDGSGYAPCTAEAVIELLKYYNIPLAGKKVVVIGRSMVIGKPLAMLLLHENATVTMCHSHSVNLPEECRRADILIVAVGVPKFIQRDHVKSGAIVIDVGIHMDENGRLCGDAHFQEIEPLASKITPVPGGVGSVTTAILALHTLKAARKSLDCSSTLDLQKFD